MLAALGSTDTRTGDVAFAVRTEHRFYGYGPDHVEWSASVVKAMLMVAYLDEPWAARRDLNAHDTDLLTPRITESDNDAAQEVLDTVRQQAVSALARRVGMAHFATSPIWSETRITAADQTRFLFHIDSYVVARHRASAMSLLADIVPSQRWGIGEVAPRGWKLYFKGGWGYGTGLLDHQMVLLVRGCARVDRGADRVRRVARLRQGHLEGHLRPPAPRAPDRAAAPTAARRGKAGSDPAITLELPRRGVAQPG